MAYTPNVKYNLITKDGKKTEHSAACFSFLSYSSAGYNQYLHIEYHLVVHPSCVPYREKWMGLLAEFGELKGMEYSYDFKKDIFTLKSTNVIGKMSLWMLTFVRYLQEFPEIVADFLNKKVEFSSAEGFQEFFKSHDVPCKFYSNLWGHGLANFSAKLVPSFEKYKEILNESIKSKSLSSVQEIYTRCSK